MKKTLLVESRIPLHQAIVSMRSEMYDRRHKELESPDNIRLMPIGAEAYVWYGVFGWANSIRYPLECDIAATVHYIEEPVGTCILKIKRISEHEFYSYGCINEIGGGMESYPNGLFTLYDEAKRYEEQYEKDNRDFEDTDEDYDHDFEGIDEGEPEEAPVIIKTEPFDDSKVPILKGFVWASFIMTFICLVPFYYAIVYGNYLLAFYFAGQSIAYAIVCQTTARKI